MRNRMWASKSSRKALASQGQTLLSVMEGCYKAPAHTGATKVNNGTVCMAYKESNNGPHHSRKIRSDGALASFQQH